MELRHLQAFLAVAEEGTFGKASRRLRISQPPLTRHIQELERELGSLLFTRGRRGVELTFAGNVLLARASCVLKSFREMEEFARSAHTRCAPLHIAVGCGLWEALERVRAIHENRFGNARINAEDLCPSRRAAVAGSADLMITRDRVDSRLFESAVLFEEQVVALVSNRHHLASRDSITLSELAAEPLLMFDRDSEPGMWDLTTELIHRAGIGPRIVSGQPHPCTLGAMMTIASGQGYYLSTASPFTHTHRTSGVAAVPLREARANIPVHLAWRADVARSARELVDSARAAFASTGAETLVPFNV